jgi:hypothetical protein
MSEAQARAWWADVEHLREAAERRQRLEAPRLRAVPSPPPAEPSAPAPARRRPARPPAPRRVSGPDRRRTVEITGRTVPAPSVPRLVEIERRRPPRSAVERVGPRPDRIAMWAPMLGFLLLLVALLSAH